MNNSSYKSTLLNPCFSIVFGKNNNGKIEYWKPLNHVFLNYIDHPEAKFEGDVGILQRRHLKPKRCVYIGKEANNIDEQELDVKKAQEFIDVEKIEQLILNLPPKEAKEYGIKHRSDLIRLKKNVKEDKLNFRTKIMREVLSTTSTFNSIKK